MLKSSNRCSCFFLGLLQSFSTAVGSLLLLPELNFQLADLGLQLRSLLNRNCCISICTLCFLDLRSFQLLKSSEHRSCLLHGLLQSFSIAVGSFLLLPKLSFQLTDLGLQICDLLTSSCSTEIHA